MVYRGYSHLTAGHFSSPPLVRGRLYLHQNTQHIKLNTFVSEQHNDCTWQWVSSKNRVLFQLLCVLIFFPVAGSQLCCWFLFFSFCFCFGLVVEFYGHMRLVLNCPGTAPEFLLWCYVCRRENGFVESFSCRRCKVKTAQGILRPTQTNTVSVLYAEDLFLLLTRTREC